MFLTAREMRLTNYIFRALGEDGTDQAMDSFCH